LKIFFSHSMEKSIISPTPGKIHLTRMLVRAEIIITPKSPNMISECVSDGS